MNFSKRTWIIVGIVILLIIIVIVITNRARAQKQQSMILGAQPTGNTPSPTGGSTNTGTSFTDSFPLKIGSKGENVKAAQILMNNLCSEWRPFAALTSGWQSDATVSKFDALTVDGVFGPKSAEAADICTQTLSLRGHTPKQLNYSEFQAMKGELMAQQAGDAWG